MFLTLTALVLLSPSAETDDAYDRELLERSKVEITEAGLLDFFRRQTLDAARRTELDRCIRDLASPRFAVRERASSALPTFGPSAKPTLEAALRVGDAETTKRIREALAKLDTGSHTALAVAASRCLRSKPSPAAARVLLDFLPFATESYVADEVLVTSAALPDGEAIRKSIGSTERHQRAAAGFVLGRSASAEVRQSVEMLTRDADEWVRLRIGQGYFAARDRRAIEPLIGVLAAESGEVRATADDLLRRLGEERKLPAPPNDDTATARATCRDAWRAWWATEGKAVDMAKVAEVPAALGFTLGIEYNTNRVFELGLDGAVRWEVTAKGPMDAQVLPGNRVLIAESSDRSVTERDFKGNVLWRKEFPQEPINCRRLANGSTFVGTRNDVIEIDGAGNEVKKFHLSDEYLHGVRRLANGGYVGITAKGEVREMDRGGKLVRTVAQQDEGRWGDVEALGGGRYLVANYGSGFVREIDAGGRTVWELKVADACGVERLPGDKFLVGGADRITVIDRSGTKLWETQPTKGSVRRAHRR